MEQLAQIVRLERFAAYVEKALLTEPRGIKRDRIVAQLARLDQTISRRKEETGYE